MARQTKPLSVKEIESAKPKEADYVLYDGDSLELLLKSSGSKNLAVSLHSPCHQETCEEEHRPLPISYA